MAIKRGGAYVDASPFIERGGVYGAVSSLVKSGGGYLAAGGPSEPPAGYLQFDGSASQRGRFPAWQCVGDFDIGFYATLDSTARDQRLLAPANPFKLNSMMIYYDAPDGWSVLIGINNNTTLHRFTLGGAGLMDSMTPKFINFKRRGGTISGEIDGVQFGSATISAVASLTLSTDGYLAGFNAGTLNYTGKVGLVWLNDIATPSNSRMYIPREDGTFADSQQASRTYAQMSFNGNILIGVDSLTAGVSNLTSWPYAFWQLAQTDGRYGGQFLCFDTIGRENQNVFHVTSGLGSGIIQIDGADVANDGRIWSPHGRGILTVPGSLVGTESFRIDSYTPFNSCRVYYLAGPGRGSFRISQPSVVNVNCSAASLQLAYVDVPTTAGSTQVTVDTFSGDVAVYGARCLTASYGPSSIQLYNFARASQKLAQFADYLHWAEWLEILEIDQAIINGGMNDKSDPIATFETALDGLMTTFVGALGAANVLIMRPNEDAGVTSATGVVGINMLSGAWERQRDKWGCKYFSVVSTVGDYTYFNSSDYMIDATHPNPAGSAPIGAALYAGDWRQYEGVRLFGAPAFSIISGPALPGGV